MRARGTPRDNMAMNILAPEAASAPIATRPFRYRRSAHAGRTGHRRAPAPIGSGVEVLVVDTAEDAVELLAHGLGLRGRHHVLVVLFQVVDHEAGLLVG